MPKTITETKVAIDRIRRRNFSNISNRRIDLIANNKELNRVLRIQESNINVIRNELKTSNIEVLNLIMDDTIEINTNKILHKLKKG